LSEITEWNIIPESEFEVRYLVGIGDINTEINLSDLSDSLPVRQVEYEPEQFPGLFYHPSEDTTITVFSTGKVSITGPKSRERLVEEFEELKNNISK
jgi:transcription initiation factor TFIID TATA-box-binding protein